MPGPIRTAADVRRMIAALRGLLSATRTTPLDNVRIARAFDAVRAAFPAGNTPAGISISGDGWPDNNPDTGAPELVRRSAARLREAAGQLESFFLANTHALRHELHFAQNNGRRGPGYHPARLELVARTEATIAALEAVAVDDPLTRTERKALDEYTAALKECAAEGNPSPEWCELHGRVDDPKQDNSESWRRTVQRALRKAVRPKHTARGAMESRSAGRPEQLPELFAADPAD